MNVERLQKVNKLAKDLKTHGIVTNLEDAYYQAEKMVGKDSGLLMIQRTATDENKAALNEAKKAEVRPAERREPAVQDELTLLNERLKMQEAKIRYLSDAISGFYNTMGEVRTDIATLKEKTRPVLIKVQGPEQADAPPVLEEKKAYEPKNERQYNVPISEEAVAAPPHREYAEEKPFIEEKPASHVIVIDSDEPRARANNFAEAKEAREIVVEEKIEAPTAQAAPAEKPHPRQGNYKSQDVSIEKFFYFGNKR